MAGKQADTSVVEFLAKLDDPQKRADSRILVAMMSRVTGEKPKLAHPGIVAFGNYHYKYASGHEGDSALTGFAPRKGEFSIYIHGSAAPDQVDGRDELLARLGKHRMGKGCLYIKRLDEVDLAVLEQLVSNSVKRLRATYPAK